MPSLENNRTREGEEGFLLVGAIVLIFLVLLALSVAAPKVARALRREREVEAIHRGNEYVRALQLYYRKFGRYPGTMDQLEKSTNIRFLRQKYTDPMTGKADWRLIHTGEAKTTVKGFFGQPLAGIATSGAGSSPGTGSTVNGSQPGGSPSSSFGSSGGLGSGSGSGSGLSNSSSSSGFSLGSGSSSGYGGTGGSSSSPGGTVSSSSSSSEGGSQSATTFSGGGAPIVGIGCSHSGNSITILNEQPTYQTWEFIYDPRIEQMKAKAALLGGGSSSGFGSGSSSGSGFGSGSSPSSGFGSSPSSSPSSGFGSGSSGSSPPPAPRASNPQ